MNSDGLKRCPYCECGNVSFGRDFKGARQDMAFCETHSLNSEAIPVELWQQRPIEDNLQAEIARLQAENAELKSLMKEAYENCNVCRYENYTLSRRCARCQALAKHIDLDEVNNV